MNTATHGADQAQPQEAPQTQSQDTREVRSQAGALRMERKPTGRCVISLYVEGRWRILADDQDITTANVLLGWMREQSRQRLMALLMYH